jgi:uncharacterized phage protein (TIGR01671 family)
VREIKFRVYDKKLRVMYTPEMHAIHNNLWSLDRAHGGVVTYSKGILMQYTGLKDKDGKEIYEGDILKVWYDSVNEIGEDSIDVANFTVEWLYEDLGILENDCNEGRVEIIGNIYENPELLND